MLQPSLVQSQILSNQVKKQDTSISYLKDTCIKYKHPNRLNVKGYSNLKKAEVVILMLDIILFIKKSNTGDKEGHVKMIKG